jgi:Methyltransferase domain
MQRVVETELLDVLPAENKQAMRSRADLRRLNALMGHAKLLYRLLQRARPVQWAKRVADLGAGDGTLLLRLAGRLSRTLAQCHAVLVDQKGLATPKTLDQFAQLGWTVEIVEADVFQWLRTSHDADGTVVIVNLFLHHFDEARLRELLHLASKRCSVFAACEPRRNAPTLMASRLLGVIGCNGVTRHDAISSVRAGFSEHELSGLWPCHSEWELCEGPAGLFSHVFLATRKRDEFCRTQ